MKHCLKTILILSLLVCDLTLLRGQFVNELKGPLLPWTKVPEMNGEKFRFVVISDLTGGEEEGVFAAAIEKINQLAPDFVISVGDLIEGYTTDQNTIDSYWKSFSERLLKLNAPFFYVAGNHDMSNKVLYDNWMKRFGYDYYTFNIGSSLFIVLSTFEPGEKGLSGPQLDCMKKALETHDPAYPVYVFSHAPLWYSFAEPGYTELMPLLNRFNTTFFCGHIETYLTRTIDGKKYFQLAKTGGGIGRENLNMGDFNHILFCTSDKGTLTVANILTGGIIPSDIVNDSTMKQVGILRSQKWFSIEPGFTVSEDPGSFSTNLVLSNRGAYPLKAEGSLPGYDRLKIEPHSISEILSPGEIKTLQLTIENKEGKKVRELPEINIMLTGTYDQNGKIITRESSKKWFIDYLHHCRSAAAGKEIFDCTRPAEIEEDWCWSGPDDGNFTFSLYSDRNSIYFHIETVDDALISFPGDPGKPQDRLYFCFSPDTAVSGTAGPMLELTDRNKPVFLNDNSSKGPAIKGSCYSKGTSLIADLVIPRKQVKGDIFRINAGFADLDDHINTDPSVIWWKPIWGSPRDFKCSGLFMIDR
jgi:3',5'-cyclic AMP phosphodiesterase CpdA